MRTLVVMLRLATATALGLLALLTVARLGVLTGPCLGIDPCETLPSTGARIMLWTAAGWLTFAALRLGGAARAATGGR
ncbi:hypothetical protein AB0368_25575 [Actinoplanes sp. NPDC051475]|uniref:hypothetical protein n=1 Tax=Actinoplanes sp. NPDC051475 TaxID=3157225 RepID=UPI00344B9265